MESQIKIDPELMSAEPKLLSSLVRTPGKLWFLSVCVAE
jgi:hypothetical protein